MGLTDMWRCGFFVVVLLAAPALAQTSQYDDGLQSPRHRAAGHRAAGHRTAGHSTEGHRRGRHEPGGLLSQAIEPSRLGPAPTGFWYHCDSPAGYYPYIPTCRTPWRFVPSALLR